MKQLTNWFTNARKRIWKPMMRREHSRQLQSAMEYEKARPREAFNIAPGAPQPPYVQNLQIAVDPNPVVNGLFPVVPLLLVDSERESFPREQQCATPLTSGA